MFEYSNANESKATQNQDVKLSATPVEYSLTANEK